MSFDCALALPGVLAALISGAPAPPLGVMSPTAPLVEESSRAVPTVTPPGEPADQISGRAAGETELPQGVRLALLGTASTSAPAQTREPSGLHARAASLDRALADARDTARAWHWSWVGLFGAGVATRVTLGLTLEDERSRTAQWVGAIPVGAGLLSQLLQPLPALSLDGEANLDPKARRTLLVRYAKAEEARRGWLQHVLGLGTNLAAAAYLLFVEDLPLEAGLQLGIGAAVSELRILTAPRAASDAVAHGLGYRRAPGPTWFAAVGPGRAALVVRF